MSDLLVVTTDRIRVHAVAELLIPGVRAFMAPQPDAVDPTSHRVQVAFRRHNASPTDTDWRDAYWVAGRTDRVGFILDVDGVGLTPGYWNVYLRVLGSIQDIPWLVGAIIVEA